MIRCLQTQEKERHGKERSDGRHARRFTRHTRRGMRGFDKKRDCISAEEPV